MSHKTPLLITLAALSVSVFFSAQAEVSNMYGVSTFGELDQLRSQNAILTEAVKNAELKSKLNHINNEVHPSYAPLNLSIPKQAQVELVSGFSNQMHTRISLPDGSNVLATVGTKVANLGVVKSISINNVVIEQGKQLISLPFAYHSSNPSSISLPGGR